MTRCRIKQGGYINTIDCFTIINCFVSVKNFNYHVLMESFSEFLMLFTKIYSGLFKLLVINAK